MSLENPSARAARARKRLDYHELNDESDNEADIVDQMEQSNTVSTE